MYFLCEIAQPKDFQPPSAFDLSKIFGKENENPAIRKEENN